ncbi:MULTISPECIES: hypothetical protein [unclassified Chryseobacterium]|uniref:hypothetical protein n=1 Tax=unclassified Chryseobacterium TaxID=2593645 RepID=UPI0027A7BFBD|nr:MULTISPECIES: hypothetical protein [unclassified Chryseobacterium]MDR6919277.1 hypothetical protein [Chryseobacterium sp. 2987]WBV56510.1 hypothetical protein PFY10_20195 [Chryseobacterium daecheongense]
MKKLRDTLENYVVKIDKHWKSLPVERQKFLTKVFFGGYVLITVIVIVNICISTGQRSNTISINHIDGISKKPIEKGSKHNEIVNSSTKK